jgi:hypothetical protein
MGKPGPFNGNVHAGCTAQILFASFESKGLFYTHITPRCTTENMVVLDSF